MRRPGAMLPVLVAAVLMTTVGAAYGQTNLTTGAVAGTVTDPDGAPLPGVTVTVRNQGTGLERFAVTDTSGFFRITLLPPASYTVTAELAGFRVARQEDVIVRLGSTGTVRMRIAPEVAEEIVVTAEVPVVDTSQRDFTLAVTEEQIENLPLLGRDFRDLIRLTPGASDAFGGRVTLNGARGSAADYNIDGADANSDFFGQVRGGTEAPFTFSQAAIQEFQVVRSTYSAEYANGVGATLNAITKSGTNEFKGQVFWFKRDAAWSADRPDTIGDQQVTSSFEARDSDQYGFALGGPLRRDKFHFFAAADIQDISEDLILDDIRRDSDYQALPAATRAAFESRVESLIGNPLDSEFDITSQDDMDTYLLKLDANLSHSHRASLRYNYSENTNVPSEGARDLRSNNGEEKNKVDSLVLQVESVFGDNMFNQAMVQWSEEDLYISPFNNTVPETQVFSSGGVPGFTFGQSEFLPNGTNEEKIQIKDAFSIFKGNHEIKAGFEYWSADIGNLFPREIAGQWMFYNINDFVANRPYRLDQGMGPTDGLNAYDYDTWGVFLHDTLRVGSHWTLDLGARYDSQTIPKPTTNYFPQHPEFKDDWKDDSNVALRFGFAWDPKADGRSVLRGGVGQYYDFLPSILYATPLSEIEFLYNRVSVTCSRAFCPTYPAILTPAQFEQSLRTSSLIHIVSPDLQATESLRTSLGWEQQLGEAYSVSVEGVYAQIDKAQRLRNINVVPSGLMFGNLVVYNPSAPNRPYTDFYNVMEHTADAEGSYKALTLSVRKAPLGSKLSWLAHYTWSESIDQDSNERSTSTSFSLDPFNPEISEGRADYDIEHRLVASGTYELPWDILLSGILTWRSGEPYTPGIQTSGYYGLNGLDYEGVNTPLFIDSSGNAVDMTQATGMNSAQLAAFLAGTHIEERNSASQPSFFTIDLRLSKTFRFGDRYGVELIGEIFNLTDSKNEFIAGDNQVVYFASQSSGIWTFDRNEDYGKHNSFNFASEPRQFQVALKFLF